jgi:hypothetical protein
VRNASSSPIDPRRAWRRAAWATGLLGSGVVAAAAAWAFQPIDRRLAATNDSETKRTAASSSAASSGRARVDLKAFDATLWSKTPVVATDAVADAERAKRAPVDLHVNLIGITDEGGHLVAALYDRDRDRVLLVKDGDELIGGARVKRLTLDEVVLKRGSEEIALARRRPER